MAVGSSSRHWLKSIVFSSMACLLVAGCTENDTYPASLVYAVRSDPMVIGNLKSVPVRFNNPGRMPLDFLATLPKKFDAEKKSRVIDYSKVKLLEQSGALRLDENEKLLIDESKANILDPNGLTAAERNKIGEILTKIFGTPANPKVKVSNGTDAGVAPEVVEKLKLKDDYLREGSALYRRHCLHCHGLEGNGRGPTGFWVNPHPRDYRQGIFKFTSSSQELGQRKPRFDDLKHILIHGIDGSSMPSFRVYSDADLDKIISYVIHLSLRGETEFYVISEWLTGDSGKLYTKPSAEEIESIRISMKSENKTAEEILAVITQINELPEPKPEEIESSLKALEGKFGEGLNEFASRWMKAQESAIEPEPYPYPNTDEAFLSSAVRGSRLFNTGSASCVSCHKNYGREAPLSFDSWGTIVKPRDLINGFYRGGRRPVDLWFRVYAGIPGANMTNYSGLKNDVKPSDFFLDDRSDPEKVKKFDEDPANIARLQEEMKSINVLWDLINFMQALHYPEWRAKMRDKGVLVE